MPVNLNTTPPTPPLSDAGSARSSAGSSPDLDQQLNRVRQALARGDLSQTDATRLRALLTRANRALTRGDVANAQRFADEAEKASGSAPGAPPERPAEEDKKSGQPGHAGQKETPTWDEDAALGEAERRTYQDASGDPGVSFKQPTKLTPGQAEVLVRFHERQHLRRDTQEARADGRKVVYAYTAIEYRTDPSTGERYVKGGKTVVQTTTDQTPKIDKKA
jgi:hypothetical protein